MSTTPAADPFPDRATDRRAALALLAGSFAGLVTMALHPTGHDVMRNAAAGAPNTRASAVHALALLAQPLVLAGTLALTRRLRMRRDGAGDVAVGAYVAFALAGVAAVIAAVASGFLAPGVLRGLETADEPTRVAMLHAWHYTGLVNQAFARFYVLLSGVAVLLWSGAMLSHRASPTYEWPRALAGYGLLLGVLLTVGAGSGYLRLDVHGFGLVALGQGVWMAGVAAHLWRAPRR